MSGLLVEFRYRERPEGQSAEFCGEGSDVIGFLTADPSEIIDTSPERRER